MVQPQKCFLHNVFSFRDTAEHAIRDRKDEAPEFFVTAGAAISS